MKARSYRSWSTTKCQARAKRTTPAVVSTEKREETFCKMCTLRRNIVDEQTGRKASTKNSLEKMRMENLGKKLEKANSQREFIVCETGRNVNGESENHQSSLRCYFND